MDPPDTLADVAELLNLHPGFLRAVLYKDGVDHYYRVFDINKKSGGTRKISAPSGHLLRIQRKIANHLQDQYRPRASVHGFVRGRSIVTNAKPHVGKDFVLNIDLKDFFPTIHFGRVLGLLESESVGFGHEAAVTLTKLACYEDRLPIGGPASPVLANMICSRMDGELQELAQEHGAFYTRYADDMTFSWNEAGGVDAVAGFSKGGGVRLRKQLVEVVESNSFAINDSKTRLMYRTQSQRVTGLVVNEKVNVSRRTIRQLRAMIHSIERDGLEDAQHHFDVSDTRDRYFSGRDISDHLNGWMTYLSMIRGNRDPVVARLDRQLKNVLAGRRRNLGVRPYTDPRIRQMDSDIEEVELTLRWVITMKLDDDASQLPQHLQRSIQERVPSSMRRSDRGDADRYARLDGLMEFADLRELQGIITHGTLWDRFESLFGSKGQVDMRFNQLAGLRNGIRHSRTVDEITWKDGEVAILWFRQALSRGG